MKNTLVNEIGNSANTELNIKKYEKGKSLMILPSNYTVIDLETTGLDPMFDDIIEISALKVINDNITDKYTTLINPKHRIDEFIEELTGITNQMLENAPTIEEKIDEFISFIGNDIVLGHNVNFDINFIYNQYKKVRDVKFQNDYVDTLRLARYQLRELHHHRLVDLIEYFNIDTKTFHRALADCESTYKIYLEIKKLLLLKYETSDNFNHVFETNRYNSTQTRAKDIQADNTDFDITNPLYKKSCVFTGALELMPRKQAMQYVVNTGGYVQDQITNDTNYLIVGNFDYSSLKGKLSNKIKKARDLQLKGIDISIISESVFYEFLNIDSNNNKYTLHKTMQDRIPVIVNDNAININTTYIDRSIYYNKEKKRYELSLYDDNYEEHVIGFFDTKYDSMIKEIQSDKKKRKRYKVENNDNDVYIVI